MNKSNFSKTAIASPNIQLMTPIRLDELRHYDCSKAYIISFAEALLTHSRQVMEADCIRLTTLISLKQRDQERSQSTLKH